MQIERGREETREAQVYRERTRSTPTIQPTFDVRPAKAKACFRKRSGSAIDSSQSAAFAFEKAPS